MKQSTFVIIFAMTLAAAFTFLCFIATSLNTKSAQRLSIQNDSLLKVVDVQWRELRKCNGVMRLDTSKYKPLNIEK